MGLKQGEVYWVDIRPPVGSEPGYRRPCVIIQNDAFNRSRINTVVVCALTTNATLSRMPGNVTLMIDEAGLPRQSVVNVTQLFTVDDYQIEEYIGSLSTTRLLEIIDGIKLVIEPSGYRA